MEDFLETSASSNCSGLISIMQAFEMMLVINTFTLRLDVFKSELLHGQQGKVNGLVLEILRLILIETNSKCSPPEKSW